MYENIILKSIDNDEFQNVYQTGNECLNVCEEFGPDRDYITLVTVLEEINRVTLIKDVKKDISSPIIQHFKEEINRINKNLPAPPMFNVVLESRAALEWGVCSDCIYYRKAR